MQKTGIAYLRNECHLPELLDITLPMSLWKNKNFYTEKYKQLEWNSEKKNQEVEGFIKADYDLAE